MLPLIRHIVEDIGVTARLYERAQTKLDLKNDLAPSRADRRILDAELSDHIDTFVEFVKNEELSLLKK